MPELHVLDDLRQAQQGRADQPCRSVPTAEQCDTPAELQRPLDANDATNVAGVPDPTRVFDVESNLIEFTSESFDIGLGEVRKLFDIGDGHRGPPCA